MQLYLWTYWVLISRTLNEKNDGIERPVMQLAGYSHERFNKAKANDDVFLLFIPRKQITILLLKSHLQLRRNDHVD